MLVLNDHNCAYVCAISEGKYDALCLSCNVMARSVPAEPPNEINIYRTMNIPHVFWSNQKGRRDQCMDHSRCKEGTLRCLQEVNEWKPAFADEFMTQPQKLHFMHPDSVIHVFET